MSSDEQRAYMEAQARPWRPKGRNQADPNSWRALAEQADRDEALAALPGLREPIEQGQYIYLASDVADPGAACWAWLRGFIGLAYDLVKAHRLYEVRVLFTFERREPR